MEKFTLYVKESYNELMTKVTWPSWAALQQTSIVVLVASVIISLIIAVMDGISNTIIQAVYGL